MGWVGTPERLYRFRAASLSPRRRMASLRDVTTLFDETARAFFRRADAVPLITGLGIFEEVSPGGGLRANEPIEIVGASGSGKTETLLQVIVSCILPRTVGHSEVGGNELKVMFFDNDYRFPLFRLVQLLEGRLTAALLPRVAAEEVESIIRSCLSRVILYRCRDSFTFWTSLLSARELLERDQDVRVLMIDSISAFYYSDRYEESSPFANLNRVVSVLGDLMVQHNLIILATKGRLGLDLPMEHEFLSSSWHSFIRHRIYLR